jgi:hypothetical protein
LLAHLAVAAGCLLWAPPVQAAAAPEKPDAATVRSGTGDRPIEAAGLRWLHLSSRRGELPVPGPSPQQTAALVVDLDRDGLNDFVLGFRVQAPALVAYRRTKTG